MTVAEEIEQEIVGWVKASATDALDRGGRDRVKKALENWISFVARKRLVPDLDKRLEDFRKRIGVLADNMAVEMSQEGYVVKAAGEAESTLRQLERGTDWFDPAGNVTETIISAIFEQRS
jgi:hypothetical protein